MPTVIVYWAPGRSVKQKEQVVERMTTALVEEAGARREDVLIIFQTIENGDAARGGKLLLSTPAGTQTDEEATSGTE